MTSPLPSPHPLLADAGFSALADYVIEHTGLAFYRRREADLATHLQKHMLSTGSSSCEAYLALLRHPGTGSIEMDALATDLTIGETYFFRYTEQFQALRDRVLPDLIRKNEAARWLRIWSAGCSTGPEPYSLSIMLRREFGARVADWDITIIGTDINREFLSRAQSGSFVEWAFRGVPDALRQACFRPDGEQWTILPAYREGVFFQYHNLVRHPFPSLIDGLAAFDLILCRNVFIYFDLETQRHLLRQFGHSLVEGGWLLVGHAESNVELFRDFQTISVPGATIYQKSAAGPLVAPVPNWAPAPSLALPIVPVAAPAPIEPSRVPEPSVPALDLTALQNMMDAGDWQQARKTGQTLLSLHRLDAATHFHAALVEEQVGSLEQAERYLRQSLYLDRSFVLAHYHLGLLLQRRGNRSGAQRSFQNGVRLLEAMRPDTLVSPREHLTAADLLELAAMHLELL